MAEKVAKLGIGREKDFMYYVKDGGVWKVQRKQPGVPKGRPEKVADGGFEMDTNYIYFVDRDGDVARAKRAVGGQKRKKAGRGASKKRRAAKKSARKAPKKKAGNAVSPRGLPATRRWPSFRFGLASAGGRCAASRGPCAAGPCSAPIASVWRRRARPRRWPASADNRSGT